MRKLGLQVLSWVDGALDFVLQSHPQHIKVLVADPNALSTIKQNIPDCYITYRRYAELVEQQQLLDNPTLGARKWADMVLRDIDRARAHIFGVEGLNETGLWNSAGRYSFFTAEYARIMRSEGLKSIAYNFPTGNPSGYAPQGASLGEFLDGLRAYWYYYLDGLRESDFVGLHEYSANTMQSMFTWQCLRYRFVWEVLPVDCRKPIMITETGIDGGVIGKRIEEAGWRAFCSEDAYVKQLDWYVSELNKDPYIFGAHIFHSGSADSKWDTFSILGCDEIVSYIRNQKESPMPEEPFVFVFGFASLHDQYPDIVGEATSPQYDVPGVMSFQRTTRGILTWRPDEGAKFLSQTLPFA